MSDLGREQWSIPSGYLGSGREFKILEPDRSWLVLPKEYCNRAADEFKKRELKYKSDLNIERSYQAYEYWLNLYYQYLNTLPFSREQAISREMIFGCVSLNEALKYVRELIGPVESTEREFKSNTVGKLARFIQARKLLSPNVGFTTSTEFRKSGKDLILIREFYIDYDPNPQKGVHFNVIVRASPKGEFKNYKWPNHNKKSNTLKIAFCFPLPEVQSNIVTTQEAKFINLAFQLQDFFLIDDKTGYLPENYNLQSPENFFKNKNIPSRFKQTAINTLVSIDKDFKYFK